jgi:hypothetical protein
MQFPFKLVLGILGKFIVNTNVLFYYSIYPSLKVYIYIYIYMNEYVRENEYCLLIGIVVILRKWNSVGPILVTHVSAMQNSNYYIFLFHVYINLLSIIAGQLFGAYSNRNRHRNTQPYHMCAPSSTVASGCCMECHSLSLTAF